MDFSTTPVYGLATGLIGFPASSLRVRIEREEMGYVWVRTASLLDAGTPLVLNTSQVTKECDLLDNGPVRHRTGLVSIG